MTDTITATGYGVVATLTDDVLQAKGTNKAFHFALVGQDGPETLVIPLSEIAEVKHTRPKAFGLANGLVDVRTVDGKRYQLHYRAKKNADFADFGDRLQAAVQQRA